jgi:sugar phosphate isomerase/epimerase
VEARNQVIRTSAKDLFGPVVQVHGIVRVRLTPVVISKHAEGSEIMNRRDFIARSSSLAPASVLTAASWPGLVAGQTACLDFEMPGAALFGVSGSLQANARETLMALGEIGFRTVEGYTLTGSDDISSQLWGLQRPEFEQVLEDAQLTMRISNFFGDNVTEGLTAIADVALQLGIDTLICGSGHGPHRQNTPSGQWNVEPLTSLDPLDRFADELNAAGETFREAGLTLAYHAHNVEYYPVNDQIPFDYLMAKTDADLVKIKLDTAWISIGEADPVGYFERYAGRIVACCIKDWDRSVAVPDRSTPREYIDEYALVEPGSGSLDFSRLMQAIDSADIEHPMIDIEPIADGLERMERGLQHLQSLRNC